MNLIGRAEVAFSAISLPLIFGTALSVTIHLALGGWFFNTRGMNMQGDSIGWHGGMPLVAITVALIGITVVSLQGLLDVVDLPGQL